MDMIVDRLSAIENAATRMIDSASLEKDQLKEQFQTKTEQFDARIDRETQQKLKSLQEELDARMADELSGLKRDTEHAIRMMEKDYETNHEKLAGEILQKMLKE
ncbi:MAG: hypothetical protein MRZ45_11455 [Blautia sp.]|nr:hypothetical protein [Blautia sp.]MDY4516801.1 hypothetical protein [Lachnospiraceae bacterium]